LLLEFSKVYAAESGEERWITVVPKQIQKIREKLELGIFPNVRI
jgi:hypothetical protein